MVRIDAIVQPFRLRDVKAALEDLGVDGMTVTEVKGCGRQRGHAEVYRGREYSTDLKPRIRIEMVVHRDDKDAVVAAICRAARTGRIGDGKIFVYPVAGAIRIRNDQRDEAAL
jgi:nitrogen regulatory protein PII